MPPRCDCCGVSAAVSYTSSVDNTRRCKECFDARRGTCAPDTETKAKAHTPTRPLQVGDVLDHMGYSRYEVTEVGPDGFRVMSLPERRMQAVTCRYGEMFGGRPLWTHADGTLIEPPRIAHAPPSVKEAHADCVDARAYLQLKSDLDAATQRANRLADECGELAAENSKLKVELADALRTVASLERRWKR